MTDDLIERLRAVKWEPTDDAERSPGDPTLKCVHVDMRPDDFRALLREAADALEAAREDAGRWNELCRQIDAGEFHPAILDDAMNMGAGALEMHVDDTIDAAREARNG